jgi:antitoxin (DNA-binding transcriptional repressor) of toxin-antitoxin stability system
MTRVSLKEAETIPAVSIRAARAGEEVVITDGDEPVARIVSVPRAVVTRSPRRAGSGKGKFVMSPDFDSPLEDMRENNGMAPIREEERASATDVHPANQPRPFGLCAGQFTVPYDFDSPLPD